MDHRRASRGQVDGPSGSLPLEGGRFFIGDLALGRYEIRAIEGGSVIGRAIVVLREGAASDSYQVELNLP